MKAHFSKLALLRHTPCLWITTILGYLDASTINADMQSELIAIAKLIPAYMQNSYQSLQPLEPCDKPPVEFTERQLTILEMIAEGLTVKAIALKLKIKECTVNHHKKVIF